MNILAEKIELAKMLLETEDPKIIESIKSIFNKEKSADFWEDLTQKQKKDIEIASQEIENGEVVDYDTFLKKHR